jgi:hypothetical protein
MRSTHKRWREHMQKYLHEAIPKWQAVYPKDYKRYFSCYVYRTKTEVRNPQYDPHAAWPEQGSYMIDGPMVWRVQVGTYRDYADFPLHKEDRAKAFAVELLLKGLCFKIIYRRPK